MTTKYCIESEKALIIAGINLTFGDVRVCQHELDYIDENGFVGHVGNQDLRVYPVEFPKDLWQLLLDFY